LKNIFKYCLILSLVLSANQLFAQITSVRGWFEVDTNVGCEGLNVNITITPSAPGLCYDTGPGGTECDTFWGDGSQTKTLSYTYNEGGEYYLRILFDNTNGEDSVQVSINESIPPEFDLFACTNRRVSVDITDSGYDDYIINDGLGNEQTVPQGSSNVILNYTDNLEKSISVRGIDTNGTDNCPGASRSIIPLNALPNGIINTLTVAESGEMLLTYNLAENVKYELQIAPNGSNSFAPLKNIDTSITTDTISNLNTQENFFCFRIATLNPCDNNTDNFSPEVCTIIPSLIIEDGFNQIRWETSDPNVNFDIIRNDLSTPIATNLSPTIRQFNDSDISCDTEYCYTIIGNYLNNSTSISQTICGTSFATSPPDPISNISSDASGQTVTFNWQAPDTNADLSYEIVQIADGVQNVLGTVDTTFFVSDLNPTVSQCVKIFAIDECGNKNIQSITACSIALLGSIDREDNIMLGWNDPLGWTSGSNFYQILKSYDGAATTGSNTTNLTFEEQDNSPQQVIQYQIIATPPAGVNQHSISNTLTLIKPNNIYFPNAFTPDGDGQNDIFRINGRFLESIELKIFNRWGEIVFYSTILNEGWDGTVDGENLPQGTYVFSAELTDSAGQSIEKEGTILIMR